MSVISGAEFTAQMKEMGYQCYKFTNDSGIHGDINYREGLITLKQPFDPSKECGPGGLYFTWDPHFGAWETGSSLYGIYVFVYDVEIPDDARVAVFGSKAKTDKFVLSNKRIIADRYSGVAERYFKHHYPEDLSLMDEVLRLVSERAPSVDLIHSCVKFIRGGGASGDKDNFWFYKALMNGTEDRFYNCKIGRLPEKYFNVWAVDHYLKRARDSEFSCSLNGKVKALISQNREFFASRKSQYRPRVQSFL